MTGIEARSRGPGLFLPVVLLTLTLLGMVVGDTVTHWRDRALLQSTIERQQAALDQVTRMRAQLDAIARETHRLAEGGNDNARRVIAALQQRGITINPQ